MAVLMFMTLFDDDANNSTNNFFVHSFSIISSPVVFSSKTLYRINRSSTSSGSGSSSKVKTGLYGYGDGGDTQKLKTRVKTTSALQSSRISSTSSTMLWYMNDNGTDATTSSTTDTTKDDTHDTHDDNNINIISNPIQVVNQHVNSTTGNMMNHHKESLSLLEINHHGQQQQQQQQKIEKMPWSKSISPSYTNHDQKLPFMPYYTYSKGMLSKLTNVQPYKCTTTNTSKSESKNINNNKEQNAYHYKQIKNDTRIINESYQSDEYRKIRMTYYDGGNKIQVFNSLWYPQSTLGDIPLLGIDLICFNGKKCLVVVDFQPLTYLDGIDLDLDIGRNDGDDDDNHWEDHLKTIYDDLPSVLKGKMSKRFYDEHQFFSKSMIFGRFEINDKKKNNKKNDNDICESILNQNGELWDAFVNYVTYHIDYVQGKYDQKMMKQTSTSVTTTLSETETSSLEGYIIEGQRKYDEYSAERDPAKPMFCKVFGDEWGNGYIHDFLFDLSTDEERVE